MRFSSSSCLAIFTCCCIAPRTIIASTVSTSVRRKLSQERRIDEAGKSNAIGSKSAKDTRLPRHLRVKGSSDSCWGAVGFVEGERKSCAATEEKRESDARCEAGKSGCSNRHTYTFTDGCAVLVWSDSDDAAWGAASAPSGKFDYEEAEKKATRTCKIYARRPKNCRNSKLVCTDCVVVSEGRPFLDSQDRLLQAEAFSVKSALWSAPHIDAGVAGETYCEAQVSATNVTLNNEVGNAWLKRGLGEHASIASFASFTLELMSNNAPPRLIRDSLRAALDEVNHALSSFEVASAFSGKPLEPGALPPSSHEFKNDMTALAISTAREGCIDETLSALAAAAEVDHLDLHASNDKGNKLLRERLSAIAVDEGRHSSLAWRTVRWACTVDSHACNAVKKEILNVENCSYQVKRRFPSGILDESFELIFSSLIPLLAHSEDAASAYCQDNEVVDVGQGKKMTNILVRNIIDGVLCDNERFLF